MNQEASKTASRRPKRAHRRPRTAPREPQAGPRGPPGPKTASEGPSTAPRRPQETLELGSYVFLRWSVASGAPQERGSHGFNEESWLPERGSYVFHKGSGHGRGRWAHRGLWNADPGCFYEGAWPRGAPQERGPYVFYEESLPPECGPCIFYEGSWPRERRSYVKLRENAPALWGLAPTVPSDSPWGETKREPWRIA